MTSSKTAGKPPGKPSGKPKRWILLAFSSIMGLGLVAVLLVAFGLAMAYPNLPALDTLTDYLPKIPLRIYSADQVLIG